MMKQIAIILGVVGLTVFGFSTDSMTAERIINIPRETMVERIKDLQIVRLTDGSRLEIGRTVVYDNVPIRDNIVGECEVKFYDSTGKLQEGKGYVIINPAQGKLKGDIVEVPVIIRFLPKR